jgi:hypothetical protein
VRRGGGGGTGGGAASRKRRLASGAAGVQRGSFLKQTWVGPVGMCGQVDGARVTPATEKMGHSVRAGGSKGGTCCPYSLALYNVDRSRN